MCGRFYVPEDASIQMIRAIVERLEHRNVKVKTGDVFPGDMAAVVASNRQMQPQPFAMEWGYHLTDGKRIINVYTYAQLVQTASKRLFNLKNKLIERYQEMNAKDYISEILNEPKQTELVLL